MNTPVPTNRYKYHRFPAEIISHAVWLYFRFCLSYRDVEELLFARGVTVTYEAIRKWCRKFGQAYAKALRQRHPRPGDTWHLEVCQTQPIKMSWAPLRLVEQTLRDLRGGFKRENEMDVNVFSRDNDLSSGEYVVGLPVWSRNSKLLFHQELRPSRRPLCRL
jgi:hypothetical protein